MSTASEIEIGVQASAFNLGINITNPYNTYSVETIFQTSKVFKKNGKNTVVLSMGYKDTKLYTKDLHSRDKLIGFNCFGIDFPLDPPTYFYNWLYINALVSYKDLA